MGKWLASGIALTLLAGVVEAEVRLPAIFSDHMVLQREREVPVWGWADPGEWIRVELNGQTQETLAGSDGKWKVMLPAMTAGGPYELKVVGADHTLTRQDVLIGEVWLASGQSNMEFQLQSCIDGAAAVAAADAPQLRLLKTPYLASATPLEDAQTAWQICTPESVPTFSAVGYFFGRKIQQELNVPVGIISAHWGGTRIEPWTPPAGFRLVSSLQDIANWVDVKIPGLPAHDAALKQLLATEKEWQSTIENCLQNDKALPAPPAYPQELLPISTEGHPTDPTELYNAMIHPYVPYAFRGALWYQGEANLSDGMLYADKMEALLSGWREVFRNPEMSFYFAQLAPFEYGEWAHEAMPKFWEAQQNFADREARSHMSMTSDAVENINDIHPRDKKTVGERMAALALKYDYGQTTLPADAARLQEMRIEDNALVLSFDQELHTADGAAPDWFEVAGAPGVFHPAVATLKGKEIKLTCDVVKRPLAMRYAWDRLAEPNLRNAAGIPLNAFRQGTLPETVTMEEVLEELPNGASYRPIYQYQLQTGAPGEGREIVYEQDLSVQWDKPVRRVAYFWRTVDQSGQERYLLAALDSFTPEARLLGVPVHSRGASFQQPVNDLVVMSNMPDIRSGHFKQGNVEFWDSNYSATNAAAVPGAGNERFDAGDQPALDVAPGYGSMQLHNRDNGQTVFAYNNWRAGNHCDLGFGNRPEGEPDWTFSGAGAGYSEVTLTVLGMAE